MEKHDGIDFAVVHLLNPKILGEVPEDRNTTNMEPLEGRCKPEDQESQVRENPGADTLEEDEEEDSSDSDEKLTEEEEMEVEEIGVFFLKPSWKRKFEIPPTSDDESEESKRIKRIRE